MTALPNLNPNAAASLAKWHDMVVRRNLDDLDAIIHADATFRSPMAFKPYRSAGAVVLLLRTVITVFEDFAYHRQLASEWTVRLGDGTDESARRMADGLDWCWRFIPELFEVDDTLQALIESSIAPDPRTFEDEYRSAIAAVLADAKLGAPADQRPILGGRRGHHSEHLGHLLAVMQFLPRTYPDATW